MYEDLKGIIFSKLALMVYLIVAICNFMRVYQLIANSLLEDVFVRFIPSIGVLLVLTMAQKEPILGNGEEETDDDDDEYESDLGSFFGILMCEIYAFLFIIFLIVIYGILNMVGIVPNLTYEIPGLKKLIDVYITCGTLIGLLLCEAEIAILTMIDRK